MVGTLERKKQKKVATQRVELFKAGSHRDSLGRSGEWSEDQLEEIAAAYNSVVGSHDAPVLVSHQGRTMESDQGLPSGTYQPPTFTRQGEAAYGWISQAYVEDGTLYGDYSDCNPDFADCVNDRTYRKRSISLYPPDHEDNPTPGKWNIRHIAYVGIPAVKGMADHSFSGHNDSGIGFWEFSADASGNELVEFSGESIIRILAAMRDRLIEMDGLEATNKLIPPDWMSWAQSETANLCNRYELEDLRSTVDALRGFVHSYYHEIMERIEPLGDQLGDWLVKSSSYMEASPSMTTNYDDDIAALRAEIAALKSENEQIRAVNQAQAFESERKGIVDFVETAIRNRKIKPEQRDQKIKLLLSASTEPTIEFGEGQQISMRQSLMDDIANGPDLWSNSTLPTGPRHAPTGLMSTEFAAPEGMSVDQDSLAAHAKAKQYCESQWGANSWKDGDKYQQALLATADI